MAKPRKAPEQPRRLFRPEIGPLLGLLALIAAGFCAGNGKLDAASWKLPAAYLESPAKGDVIFSLASFRAAADGHFLPLLPKTVPELNAPSEAHWDDWPAVEEFQVLFAGLLGKLFGLFAGFNLFLLF